MTSADAALSLFTLFNAVRVLAYLPQIAKIARDTQGAAAVSITTWTMFALSHASTVAYAVLVVGDLTLAGIFCLNAAFCAGIVLLTLIRRRRFRHARDLGGRPGPIAAPIIRPTAGHPARAAT